MNFYGTRMNLARNVIEIRENFPMKEKDIFLSQNLKNLMKENNIKLNTLANIIGMNKSTLHNYLNGSFPQSIMALRKLSQYFNLSVDELIFSSVHEKKHQPPISIEGHYNLVITKKESF